MPHKNKRIELLFTNDVCVSLASLVDDAEIDKLLDDMVVKKMRVPCG